MLLKKSLIALFVTLFFISCSDNDSENLISGENATITQQIHKLVNQHRASIGKSELTLNNEVSVIALKHTKYMIGISKINHDMFDDRFKEMQNLDNAKSAAENVASHQKTAEEVVNAWLNSSGHRKNIEGNYTHTGIGVEKNSAGHYYFTQLFYSK
ncbi:MULTISPECIES: CAP domain-containing protein [unclassified Tenacibaculum]|uniref:CAP domain-containing protein n=1 Tax=unclassified Tenacibaculum TaxID=2635139 RepID=UPI001F325805|nr:MULTISPECIES: CAP domain-containing protein [unclassified Tenacibaculum]MCF2873850.1 CAP domain-containing protein [Tenacibaculum sp. Cn5-1]MCF2936660.1 CAP domain-containing protein [Tenacibaculum sp. Cn5-34]MCG7512884.1 CAP domain-containing protein [Tenacibaculum sp. Cn5-46]